MWNSVISVPGTWYMTADVTRFTYALQWTDTSLWECQLISFSRHSSTSMIFSPRLRMDMSTYTIIKGMYGLPQADMLANKFPQKHGYYKLIHIPGFFTHRTRPIWFTLSVDDFGVKYVDKEHTNHLMLVLCGFYEIEEDWMESLYYRTNLNWNYQDRYLDISMPNYVSRQLLKYTLQPPKQPQLCPFSPAPTNYGKEMNIIIPEQESPKLDKHGKTYIQQVIGSFLYYTNAIDMKILHALSEIASQQVNPTK